MNKFKRFVSLALVLCMVMAFVPVGASAAEDVSYAYNIVHVDAGRKYFSVDSLKTIIDNAAAAGFNQVELYLSDNQGFRFALDDMTLTTGYGTYDLTPALGDGYSDGSKYPDYTGKYLTQAEMDEIISYANGVGIDIVPCINVPGHMGAILEEFTSFKYSGSNSSIDLANEEAVAFALALTEKYAAYFASKGCKFYNVGADEYANDLSSMGFEGMGEDLYTKFVQFLNDAADIVIGLGMTPRAFNDGFYYKDYSISIEPNKAYEVCYWSSGWSGYDVAAASTIAAKGHKMINTNGDYYWVLGNSSWQCSASKASQFDETAFQGSTVSDPAGSMFCIWCDVGNADTEANVVADTAATIAAFGAAVPAVESLVETGEETTPAETEPEEEEPVTSPAPTATEERAITVTVGGTATDTITGGAYTVDESELDTSIATVDAVSATIPGGTETTLGDQITPTNTSGWSDTGVIKCGDYYLVMDGTSLSATTDVNEATVFTVTRSGSNRYTIRSGSYYLRYNNGLSFSTSSTEWRYSNGFYYSSYGSSYYLTCSNGSWSISSSSSTKSYLYDVTTTDKDPVDATTVTFTGVKVGTAYATVGNVHYTITVVAEDLSQVDGLEIEYWITNRQVTANGATGMTISAADAYGVNGKLLSELVPNEGTYGNNTMKFWKGTRHPSGEHHSASNNRVGYGTDFNYVRYYNGSWAYSADGRSWTNVLSSDQFVAFYLQATTVTQEVETQVVDWGDDYTNSYNIDKYVLLDYAVKYESGEITPDAFPIANTTLIFHCNWETDLNNTVFRTGSQYYRRLGMIRAEETSEYDVYMITLTPTSDEGGNLTENNVGNGTGHAYNEFYAGTEKVVWVDDEANLGNFADESLHYQSISGNYNYTVGGDPVIPALEIYNETGMLVTYYVKAKVTEDSLTVHYIDRSVPSSELEFYSYNIAVKEGTYFHKDIGLNPADPNGDLLNGDVTNIYNNTQTVSADLTTLSQIGAQYLSTKYDCVEVIYDQTNDPKNVYLYYEFQPRVYFIADFGLGMEITGEDLHESFTNDNIADISFTGTAYTSYGKLTKSTDSTTITYQPIRTMQGVDFVTLVVTTRNAVSGILGEASTKFAFRVYIVPANTVYYEETFATYEGGWSVSTADSALRQETQDKTADPYGWTDAYTTVGASGGTEATSSTGVDLAAGITQPDSATFTFTGTGVDIYANANTDTSIVFVTIRDASGALKKMYQVDTVAKNGTSTVTSNQAAESYGLPIVSVTDLAHGTYTVELTHTKSAHYTNGAVNDEILRIDGFRVYNTLGSNAAAYYSDAEKAATFVDVRDSVLTSLNVAATAGNFDAYYGGLYSQVYTEAGTTSGMVVLSTATDAKNLVQNGPKNEIFLQPGDALTFSVSGDAQIGLKAVTGAAAYAINDGAGKALNTSTEMYYDVTGVTTIRNTGSTLLSITKLKLLGETQVAEVTAEQIGYALTLMGLVPVDAEVDAPEQEVYYRDAALTVKVTDYKGHPVADLTLTANGVQGEAHTFTAAEILAAVKAQLPEAYALVNESKLSDVTVAFGGSETIVTRAGKAAVVTVTFVDLRTGAVVGEGEIVSVQTSDRSWVQITASDIRQIAPAGYKVVKAQSLKAAYGSSYSMVVTVG